MGFERVGHDLATKPAPYIKYIANENLLYSIRNYTQYLVITYSVKEFEKEYIHMCVCMCVGCLVLSDSMQPHGL